MSSEYNTMIKHILVLNSIVWRVFFMESRQRDNEEVPARLILGNTELINLNIIFKSLYSLQ